MTTASTLSARQMVSLMLTLLVQINDSTRSEDDRRLAYNDLAQLLIVIQRVYPEMESDIQALFRINMTLLTKAVSLPTRSVH